MQWVIRNQEEFASLYPYPASSRGYAKTERMKDAFRACIKEVQRINTAQQLNIYAA